jgi:hypothetical protein
MTAHHPRNLAHTDSKVLVEGRREDTPRNGQPQRSQRLKRLSGRRVPILHCRSAVNVQFMVKDSKKYAATDGWGYADFTDGKPGNEALHKTCHPCHAPAKDSGDFVFTRYAR